MIVDILEQLSNEWRPILAQANIFLAPPMTALQIGGGDGEGRKINFLIFSHGKNRPELLVKMMREPKDGGMLAQEFQSLTEVWDVMEMRDRLPEPIGLVRLNGHQLILEKIVAGHSLEIGLARSGYSYRAQQKQLNLVADWLLDWQQATSSGTIPFSGETAVRPLLMKLSTELPDSLTDQLLQEAGRYEGLMIPICAQHGDFWPGNMFIEGEKLSLIDWEDFALRKTVFRDLFTFAVTYGSSFPLYRWLKWGKSRRFSHTFLQRKSQPAQLINRWVRTIWAQYQLPPNAIHLFFTLFLLQMSFPEADESRKRVTQAVQWKTRTDLYLRHAQRSIFYEK